MEEKIKVNCVIGIDPGANGGIAVFIPGQLVKVVKMPKEITDIAYLLQYYRENYAPIVFLEKLNLRADDVALGADGKPNMGKIYRVQKLMANYEHLKALIESTGTPYVMVHPMTWQTRLGLRMRGEREEKAERKRRYAETAATLYPNVKVALWNSDALLIMHFGRRILAVDAAWVRANLPIREHTKIF